MEGVKFMSSDKPVRMHILFYGDVQGVGFRWKATRLARDFGLTGWVNNLSDGSVEMEIQGKTDVIYDLIRMMNQDRYIHIRDYKLKIIPVVPNEKGFHPGYQW